MVSHAGLLEAIALAVAVALVGGLAGLWASASPTLARWVEEAKSRSGALGAPGAAETSAGVSRVPAASAAAGGPAVRALLVPGGRGRASLAGWVVVPSVASGLLAGVMTLPAARGTSAPSASVALAFGFWAAVLALAGLIDSGHLVLPTPLLRWGGGLAAGSIACSLAAGHQWQHLWLAALSTVAGGCGYLGWWVARREAVGLGDVRMACLVAFGVGSYSAGAALVVLSCAPLLAGLLAVTPIAGAWAAVDEGGSEDASPGRGGGRPRSPGRRRVAVPLGPFLALGGLAAVVPYAL
ncbi:MAG TPA: hypothetical protein VL984_02600 [Acidimicrobiales bacterium]|nr:hypothetical protein [Acidimicrobiales bacterium]